MGPRHAATAGDERPQHRGPARAPAGRPRPRAGAQAPARAARPRDRRRWLDRLGDRPPGRPVRPRAARPPRPRRDAPPRHGLGLQGIAEPEVVLADIRDASVVETVFHQVRPEIVFHAAAHKHVPILEDSRVRSDPHQRASARSTCVDACASVGRRRNSCASRPTRPPHPRASWARRSGWPSRSLLERAAHDGYRSVRFGNVLGSRGSVIPTFQRQIAAGGPVTVTDPRMTRFFMSTDEAVRLVLLGASLDGDHQILALEMGEQVNIYALAERMIRLCGLRPQTTSRSRSPALRPGEKLAEVLDRAHRGQRRRVRRPPAQHRTGRARPDPARARHSTSSNSSPSTTTTSVHASRAARCRRDPPRATSKPIPIVPLRAS